MLFFALESVRLAQSYAVPLLRLEGIQVWPSSPFAAAQETGRVQPVFSGRVPNCTPPAARGLMFWVLMWGEEEELNLNYKGTTKAKEIFSGLS